VEKFDRNREQANPFRQLATTSRHTREKKQLQELIKDVTDTIRAVSFEKPLRQEVVEQELQSAVHDLMKMEIQNRNDLHARHKQSRTIIQETDMARSTLRLIHRAYAPALAANWQSYS